MTTNAAFPVVVFVLVLVLSEALLALDLGSRVGSLAGFSTWVDPAQEPAGQQAQANHDQQRHNSTVPCSCGCVRGTTWKGRTYLGPTACRERSRTRFPVCPLPVSLFFLGVGAGIGVEIGPRQGKMPSCVSRPAGIDFDSDPDSDLDCSVSSCTGTTSFAVHVDEKGASRSHRSRAARHPNLFKRFLDRPDLKSLLQGYYVRCRSARLPYERTVSQPTGE